MQENFIKLNEKPILLNGTKDNANQATQTGSESKRNASNIFERMENQIQIDFQPIPIHELLAKFKDIDYDTPTKNYETQPEEVRSFSDSKSGSNSTDSILNRTIIEDTTNVDSQITTPPNKKNVVNITDHNPYTNELVQNIDMKIEIRDIFKSKPRKYSKTGRSQTVGSHDFKNEKFDNPFLFLNLKKNPEEIPIEPTPKSTGQLSHSLIKHKQLSILKENNVNLLKHLGGDKNNMKNNTRKVEKGKAVTNEYRYSNENGGFEERQYSIERSSVKRVSSKERENSGERASSRETAKENVNIKEYINTHENINTKENINVKENMNIKENDNIKENINTQQNVNVRSVNPKENIYTKQNDSKKSTVNHFVVNNIEINSKETADEIKKDRTSDKPKRIQFSLPSKHQRPLSKQLEPTRSGNGYKPPSKSHSPDVRPQKVVETPLINVNGELKCDSKFRTIVVKGKEYIVINKLGEGGSCQVFDCLDPISLEHRAIKIVNLAVDEITAKGYVNEVKMLKTLQGNECVIKMFDYEISKSTLFVIMQKGGIDLSTFLRNIAQKSSRLPMHVINYYWMEMLNCVKEIHDAGIIHSDLKPSNFLIVDGRLKLIDFGIASRMSADMTSVIKNVQVGTFNYISPEALLDSRGNSESPNDGRPRIRISYKSDVWSLGCILYQLVYRRTPFHNIGNTFAKVSMIVDPNHVIEYPHIDGVPQKCIDMLKKCLQYDMKHRPTVAELLSFYNAS